MALKYLSSLNILGSKLEYMFITTVLWSVYRIKDTDNFFSWIKGIQKPHCVISGNATASVFSVGFLEQGQDVTIAEEIKLLDEKD